MVKIFISYRRTDSTDATGRIYDRLVAAFGVENVFKDVDSIPLGSDFAEVIAERMKECDVAIVVIGKLWLSVRGKDETPRLLNSGDYVRIEIEQALNSDVIVIPALIGNSEMPNEEQIPETLRQLSRKHAISIRSDPDFHKDMSRLMHGIRIAVGRKKQTRLVLSNNSKVNVPKKSSSMIIALLPSTIALLAIFLVVFFRAVSYFETESARKKGDSFPGISGMGSFMLAMFSPLICWIGVISSVVLMYLKKRPRWPIIAGFAINLIIAAVSTSILVNTFVADNTPVTNTTRSSTRS